MDNELKWAAAFAFAIATPFVLFASTLGFLRGGGPPLRGAWLLLVGGLLLWAGALVALLRWVGPLLLGGAAGAVILCLALRAVLGVRREGRNAAAHDHDGVAEEPPPAGPGQA